MALQSDGDAGASYGELLAIALLIVFAMTIEIIACKPRVLLDGPFWLDECITDQIVEDPSLAHAMGAVRHGVDTNPPVFHVIDRVLWRIERAIGIHSPRVGLRLISIASVMTALLLLYALLRRTFPIWPALAGIAAVWAHPDVVEQATDARFYTPLLLATVAVIFLGTDFRRGWFKQLLLALSAALLCTLHYFGIIALGCVGAAIVFVDDRPLKARLLSIAPMLTGPIALLPFLPWIHDQSAGLTIKTWLDPFSFYTAKAFLGQVLCPLALAIVVGAWVISRFMRQGKPRNGFDRKTMLPLFSLVVVPLVIVLFSATVQSALRSRYAIPSTLIFAPLAAMVANSIDRKLVVAMIVLFIGLSVLELHGNSSRRGALMEKLMREQALIKEAPFKLAFAARSDAVELQQYAPELASKLFIVNENAPDVQARDFRRYETDMVRKTAAWYPIPMLIDEGALSDPRFTYLSVAAEDLPAIAAQTKIKHVADDVYEIIDHSAGIDEILLPVD